MGTIQVNTTGRPPCVVTVRVNGEIDPPTADQLRTTLVDVIMRRRPDRFVVDLDGVTALDAAAIGTLCAARTTAEDTHLDLIFHTAGSPVCAQLDRDGIHHDPVAATATSRPGRA